MKKRKITPLLLSLMLGSTVQAAEFYSNSSGSQAIKDSYIIVYNTPAALINADITTKAAFTESLTTKLSAEFGLDVEYQYDNLGGVAVKASSEQLLKLLSHPDIKFIEQNATFTIDPEFSDFHALQNNPTWGLDRIDQRDRPLDKKYVGANNGQGVTAYIIDTGVLNSHNDFGGRARNGYDFVDNDAVSQDCNGHGTHVAGTIGGSQYGVAKAVDLVGVRVLNCSGSGSYAGVIAGIDWVAGNASGPSVANMSLGGGKSQAVNNAVANAVNRGITFVVAAGNDRGDACSKSPASEPSAITVASSDINDARSGFSNYGKCVDVFAPGSSITSAWIGSNSATKTISGTSMASPHVAGVAALHLSKSPNLNPAQVTAAISNNASQNKISDLVGSPNKLVYAKFEDQPGDGLVEIVSGNKGQSKVFPFNVASGTTKLVVSLSGGTGDADLYIKHGQEPYPIDNDCASENPDTSNESCVITNPASGTWYLSAYGYSAFNNVTLKAEAVK
ncbi:alkaline serine protease [Pseudoalteromonas piscicida]|uniref:Alkaline serine protease n=1 Tax=Pseudoalteromonas piscicida TaxID=43662 RepID=A0AAQ2ESW5_PSEO7|nr:MULTISPECIES: S8 family serine peptidase [Pseudoalteromonas]KJY89334.1 alkaline serine protease [Pseudoalteromonas piscicida]TMN38509.1 alkaline serine protease [Pseudoalteromonas piscicida]TMN42290.1 alkaline serine protease [Pseudoalteromonas piscicida]TMN47980.1 alkaline serine protease [Pseudoalteromonas piscicida]TMN55605.1 alkaline serine protease [Pseudoalteromonas piscicida]